MTSHTIDFRFVREAGLTSWIIDRATGGFLRYRGPRWSHVGIMILGKDVMQLGPKADLRPDRLYEFGARSNVDKAASGKPGAQFREQDYAEFIDRDMVSVPVTGREWLAFWRLALKIEGAPYSERTIAGFLEGVDVPENPGSIAFDCSTLCTWLSLHGLDDAIPQAFRGEQRQVSPNAFYYIARMAAFYRRALNSALG